MCFAVLNPTLLSFTDPREDFAPARQDRLNGTTNNGTLNGR